MTHCLSTEMNLTACFSVCLCVCESVGIFMVVSFQFSYSLKIEGLHVAMLTGSKGATKQSNICKPTNSKALWWLFSTVSPFLHV